MEEAPHGYGELEKIWKSKRKKRQNDRLKGGALRPKARMICGFSLKTSAIYGIENLIMLRFDIDYEK